MLCRWTVGSGGRHAPARLYETPARRDAPSQRKYESEGRSASVIRELLLLLLLLLLLRWWRRQGSVGPAVGAG